MLIFIIPALMQQIPGFSFIPKVLGIIILMIIIIMVIKRLSILSFFLILNIIFISLYSMLNSKNLLLNIKDLTYFVTFILFCNIISEKYYFNKIKLQLEERRKLIKKILYISNMIIIISFFFSQSYYDKWGEGTKYFRGFTIMPHVMASICLYLIILTMYYLKPSKFLGKESFLYVVPSIAILSTGARTFLVPIIIIGTYIFYNKFGFWKVFYASIIGVPVFLIIFKYTSIYSKFIYLVNFEHSDSLISKLTSGRSDIWVSCIKHYSMQYNILEKICGVSFDHVYSVIKFNNNMNIWAHNDLINTIITSGILGLIIYVISFAKILKIFCINKFRFLDLLIFCLVYIFIMLTNGLFITITSIFSMVIFIQLFKGEEK